MKLRTKRMKRSRKHGFGRIGMAYSFVATMVKEGLSCKKCVSKLSLA